MPMQDKIEKLRSLCSDLNFAEVDLSGEEEEFRGRFNRAIIALCKSLPPSTHTDAILFFTRFLVTPVGRELNFFKNYYAPAWSILYWLIHSKPADKRPAPEDIQNAVAAHAMALLLHPLDDHLHDGQLPATHLTVLFRSQAWMLMNMALDQLCRGAENGEMIVRGFVDDYYGSIGWPEGIRTLDSYCDLFRKQMATWFIVPVLMAKKMAADESLIRAIQEAYGSFGIAWRLLDDLRDIESDMLDGNRSAIYFCLPEPLQAQWDKGAPSKDKNNVEAVWDYLHEQRVVDTILERLGGELDSAAGMVDDFGMKGLARQLRCLGAPLGNLRGLG